LRSTEHRRDHPREDHQAGEREAETRAEPDADQQHDTTTVLSATNT
jgi:hypothetical protein